MKFSLALLVVISIGELSCSLITVSATKYEALSRAINSVLINFFNGNSISYDIISFSKDKTEFDEILQNFPRECSDIPHRQHQVTSDRAFNFKLNQSAILLFDSFTSYLTFIKNAVLSNLTSRRFYFLVYFPDATFKHLTNFNRSNILQFQSILFQFTGGFRLASIVSHSSKRCYQIKQSVINSFQIKSMTWTTKEYFPRQVQNFLGCPVIFWVRSSPPAHDFRISESSHEFYGYNLQLIETLAKQFNFTSRFAVKNDNRYVFPDMALTTKVLTPNAAKSTFLSQPYVFETISVMIPPGKAYSSFEKMFLPFESEVWIWLSITLTIAIITIFAFNFLNIEARNFVFGENVKNPILNIWIAFCGGSQTTLPKRNFARFLLISFILFCLVLSQNRLSRQEF